MELPIQYDQAETLAGEIVDMSSVNAIVIRPSQDTEISFRNNVPGKTSILKIVQPKPEIHAPWVVTLGELIQWGGSVPDLLQSTEFVIAVYDDGQTWWLSLLSPRQTFVDGGSLYLIDYGERITVPPGRNLLWNNDLTNRGTLINHGRVVSV